MFYDGDLQSGIASAIKDSKAVVCFVRGDDHVSSRFEDGELQDPQIRAALNSLAVVLRINSGSQEAEFLSAYYPIRAVPVLLIMRSVTYTASPFHR